MTPTAPQPANEWRRLASASSLADVVARHVDGLAQLTVEELPDWLTGLGVPAGWHIARFDNPTKAVPSRIAVTGATSRGGWEGCDTIALFRFTGMPPLEDVRDNAACTLRDLDARDITTQLLATPPQPGVIAVRASGSFNTVGRQIWAQYSTYLAGSDVPDQGRLIQHSVFVESRRWARLHNDIVQLSDATYYAFVNTVLTARGTSQEGDSGSTTRCVK